MKTVLLTAFLLLTVLCTGLAQTTIGVDTTNGKPYYILLTDGSHIQGRIIKRDSTMYTIRMKNGQLTYVERTLFKQLSNTAPTSADSVIYFPPVGNARTAQPVAMTVSPSLYEITLTDGTRLKAEVISQDSSRVVVRNEALGTVYIPAKRVVRMERPNVAEQGNQQGSSTSGNPNLFPQYLNLLPSAYQAERGRVYYRNTAVYFSQFDVGLTDNWSIGATFFTFLPTLVGAFSTKLSAPLGARVRVGLQAQLFYGSLGNRTTSTGFLQGIVSVGDSQNNITVGLGSGTSSESIGQLVSVSVVRKIRPSITFISENLLLIGRSNLSVGKLGAGIRFDRQRHSFDISLNLPFGPDGIVSGSSLFFLPSASYQVRIGK